MQEEKRSAKIIAWLLGQKLKIEKNAGTLAVFVLLLFWLAAFLNHPVSLINTDLGRHIENGRYFFETHQIPSTNLYSYTHPAVPFVNHHWGSGIIFFFIWKLGGWAGLSFFYIGLSLLTFGLLFFTTKSFSGLAIATFSAVLAIPLVGERTEIRPEVFSYFLSAVFFVLLWRFRSGQLRAGKLFFLPLLSLAWVNLHIYFVFGLGLVGLFFLEALLIKKAEARLLFLVLILSVAASLVNPFGFEGLVYPLNIFRNYGYPILENQSVGHIDRLGFINNSNLIVIKLVLLALVLSQILLIVKNRQKTDWMFLGLGVAVSVLGWSALRNFSLFGYFALPVIAYNLKWGLEKNINLKDFQIKTIFLMLSFLVSVFFIDLSKDKLLLKNDDGQAFLATAQKESAAFFRENNLAGPIFNNYDIGSFLIFELFPKEKVFVDNRPEAYPEDFFQKIYIPMQLDQAAWDDVSQQYEFNAVYFYVGDLTNWGQAFLVRMIYDQEWSPVFADNFAIIFLKRNQRNQELIDRFEIPRSNFGIKNS